jgi:hypothetical protein
MGSGVGVHKQEDVDGLSPEQRAKLKEEIIKRLQTSEEIRKIIRSHPTLLETIVKSHPDFAGILRKEVRPTYEDLSKNK